MEIQKQINISEAVWKRLAAVAKNHRRTIRAQAETMLEQAISIEEKARKYEGQ